MMMRYRCHHHHQHYSAAPAAGNVERSAGAVVARVLA